MYTLNRKDVSQILGVSVRTVDRYISGGKLSIERKNGRIWLDRKEVAKFRNSLRLMNASGQNFNIDNVDTTRQHVYSLTTSDADSANFKNQPTPNNPISSSPKEPSSYEIYKQLFEEFNAELKVRQERLEGANYRVGQLEAMIKDYIPKNEHQALLSNVREENNRLLGEANTIRLAAQKSLQEERLKQDNLHQKLKESSADKRIYLILLFILLALQPLWLFLASH